MSALTGGLVSVTFRQLPPAAVVDLTAQAGLAAIEWVGDVHVPPTDPLQLGNPLVLWVVAPAALEYFWRPRDELLLPAAQQRLFDPMFPTNLRRTLDAGQHFQHDLGFEPPTE